MKTRARKFPFLSLLFIAGAFAQALMALPSADAPDPLIVEQENLLRREAQEQIQRILDPILGIGKAYVVVNVEMSLESDRKENQTTEGKVDDRKGLGEQDFILPWVPAPKSVNKANEVAKDAKVESTSGGSSLSAVRQVVTRFDVTIIHDDDISAVLLGTAEKTIRSVYERFSRIMRVTFTPRPRGNVRQVSQKVREGFWDFLKPQNLLFIFLLLVLLTFIILLGTFFRALPKALMARKGGDMTNETTMKSEGKSESENEGENGDGQGLSETELEAQRLAEEATHFVPFAYVNENNIKRLIYLIRKEPPDVIALVTTYLKPEMVKEVLLALPPQLQARVAMHMAAVKQMTQVEIRSFDAEIKEKIEFLVGGLHALLKVLEDVDYQTRDNILEYLKNERPTLYEKVRQHFLTFEDLGKLPDATLQYLIRELRAESLAKALRDLDPEIVEKFLRNMSKGASELLKEEMEFSRAITPEQVDEERQKVLGIVKKLEDEGKFTFRPKPPDSYLDVEDMEVFSSFGPGISSRFAGPPVTQSPEAAAASAESAAYLDAGVRFYNEGKFQEAVPYLEYAAAQNPAALDAWLYLANARYSLGLVVEALADFEKALALNPGDTALRQWVDAVKAQTPGTVTHSS